MAVVRQEQQLRLAKIGAAIRLKEIREEVSALKAFLAGKPGVGKAENGNAAPVPPKKKTAKRRKMNKLERRAISERMKRYWAGRRSHAADAPEKTNRKKQG